MDNVIEALNLISHQEEGQVVSGMELSSLILRVYSQGHEEAAAALLYRYNYDENILRRFGHNVPRYIQELKALNLTLNYSTREYVEILGQLDDECLVIVICDWLCKVQESMLGMGIMRELWDIGKVLIPIFRERLGNTNVEFYINQIDIHLETLKVMGWVKTRVV